MQLTVRMVMLIVLLNTILFALSADIKFDMLKTKLSQQLKASEYKSALSTMKEIRNLEVKIPSSFDYFEGKALFESGNPDKAYIKMESYVNATGKNGKYYKKALQYLIKSESAIIVNKQKKIKDEKRKAKKEREERERDKFYCEEYVESCLYARRKLKEDACWRSQRCGGKYSTMELQMIRKISQISGCSCARGYEK